MCGSVANNRGMWARGAGVFWGRPNSSTPLTVGGDGGGL